MQNNRLLSKKLIIRTVIIFLVAILTITFVKFDYFMYEDTVATIKTVKNTKVISKKGYEGRYEEDYYKQDLTGQIRNGIFKGKVVYMENRCTKSGVYDITYHKGDDVFIEKVEEDSRGNISAVVTSPKRDFYVVTALVLMLAFFVLIGGSKSVLTVISLALNLCCFYVVILLYFKGLNILAMSIPMVIVFAAMLLLFMYGKNIKTLLAFVATVITIAVTLIIACIALNFSDNIEYDFLEYIIQPYDPVDARNIFLAEILVGCLGAVMDVVVTMIVTIEEINLANPNMDKRSILKSCRNVGDEIVGTMIAIMFFTNLASDIPFFILSMRNGIAIRTILRYNYFFEIGRFLTGSIAVVLAIPIASFIGVMFYKRRLKKC